MSRPPRPVRPQGDWREATLARLRALILEAVPGVTEERKWKKASNAMAGVPVWSRDGIICTGESYKDKVKLTFAKGAALADPAGLFNAGLAGGTRRAIDIHEGEQVAAGAFKALVKAAAAQQGAPVKRVASRAAKAKATATVATARRGTKAVLLSRAIRRSRKPTAMPRCRPTSRPGRP